MGVTEGRTLRGIAGHAVEIVPEGIDRLDWRGTVACWLLYCPLQAAWDHYQLSCIHLRDIEGVKPAHIRVPGATHEFIVAALDPALKPVPDDPKTWRPLTPLNVEQQCILPDDTAAIDLTYALAREVVEGGLPAEPLLAGQREPWQSTILESAAHLRGEHGTEVGG